jgi:AAA+ superfamily predicted ATPase
VTAASSTFTVPGIGLARIFFPGLRQALRDADLVALKKQLVERDCNGLIEFIESKRSLDDLHGQEKVKEWLRADFALWKKNDIGALPMGYLLCGPVGTGKTYMVECLPAKPACRW